MSMRRTRLNPPEEAFSVDPSALESLRFGRKYVPQAKTPFALASGYLGNADVGPGGWPIREPVASLNGFYDYAT